MTEQQRQAGENATQILDDLNFLLGREEFQRFWDRLRNQADAMADDVLHNDAISKDQREEIRQKRLGLLEALKAPKEDMDSAAALLKGMNADPDEIRRKRN
jgi:hypothetical protein